MSPTATAMEVVAENAISTTTSRAWWRTRREPAATPVAAVGVMLIGSTPLGGTEGWVVVAGRWIGGDVEGDSPSQVPARSPSAAFMGLA